MNGFCGFLRSLFAYMAENDYICMNVIQIGMYVDADH